MTGTAEEHQDRRGVDPDGTGVWVGEHQDRRDVDPDGTGCGLKSIRIDGASILMARDLERGILNAGVWARDLGQEIVGGVMNFVLLLGLDGEGPRRLAKRCPWWYGGGIGAACCAHYFLASDWT
jgi:hypothetical protein